MTIPSILLQATQTHVCLLAEAGWASSVYTRGAQQVNERGAAETRKDTDGERSACSLPHGLPGLHRESVREVRVWDSE